MERTNVHEEKWEKPPDPNRLNFPMVWLSSGGINLTKLSQGGSRRRAAH